MLFNFKISIWIKLVFPRTYYRNVMVFKNFNMKLLEQR